MLIKVLNLLKPYLRKHCLWRISPTQVCGRNLDGDGDSGGDDEDGVTG